MIELEHRAVLHSFYLSAMIHVRSTIQLRYIKRLKKISKIRRFLSNKLALKYCFRHYV